MATIGDELLTKIKNHTDTVANPGASAEAIEAAEKRLGVQLPPSHKQFLLSFDGGEFGDA